MNDITDSDSLCGELYGLEIRNFDTFSLESTGNLQESSALLELKLSIQVLESLLRSEREKLESGLTGLGPRLLVVKTRYTMANVLKSHLNVNHNLVFYFFCIACRSLESSGARRLKM